MGRKEQQEKVDGIADLINTVTEHLHQCSDCLSEMKLAGHMDRLEKLQAAAVKLNDKLSTAAPFASEPVPGFHGMCEKLRSYVIKEYLAVARLTHQKFLAFEKALVAYEQVAKQEGHVFDLEEVKEKLQSVTQEFRHLGSKELYKQGNDAIDKAVTDCEQVRSQAEELLDKALEELQAMLPAKLEE